MAVAAAPMTLAPPDQHNLSLAENVHPAAWINPEPAARYNLVVIGAGTAGLVTAAGAAGLGARVALVERYLMGGDCLNFGCVPSKALIRASRTAAEVRDAARMGVLTPQPVRIDFARVMERVRRLRAELSQNDSAERLRRLGVDIFLGDASFARRDAVAVGGKTLRFKRAAITTGAHAAALSIPGLSDIPYLTNETVFSLTALPRRLAVIGAGPLGCELAQAFRRLGAEVVLLEVMPQILIREDRDAAMRIEQALLRDGVSILTGCKILLVEQHGREKLFRIEQDRAIHGFVVDEILLGVGRAPNVEGLNLEAAGVAYDPQRGIIVNDHLQTTNRNIYAAGDVCTPYRFTHMADAMARIVIRNALFFGRARVDALTLPWCTYTDPEIAHVGLDEAEAKARGIRVQTFVQELAGVDRAVLDGETAGFVKLHLAAGSDRIVGATVVASHASEIISELTLAMSVSVGLRALANVIHPYPTQGEAIRKVADAYQRTRLTPFVKNLFERILKWRR